MKVLITGGAGFIGSHVIEHIIRTTTWTVVCIDKLSYSSKGWARLQESGVLYNPRLTHLTWDLEMPFSDGIIREIGDINIIIHMAAETHVDKSIADPVQCIRNNVMSTTYLLEHARSLKNLKMFQYFSTDEVFGPAPKGVNYKEWDRHRPTNPYSASKAASEDICLAYQNTYKIPVLITNLMNVYGEKQYIEKFVPLVIKKVLNDETVDIHTEPDGITPGSRFYIHARNVASAVLFILEKGEPGEKYNITGECEVDNLEMARKVAAAVGKPLKYNLVDFHESRPGHDCRYSLDGTKLFEMGWKLPVTLDQSLTKTVKWTLMHPQWLEE
ncbi:6 dehydratase [uncultured virus]|nr:6 dehydratase [uncultured virus]